ncbi:MAG: hypothetical protein Q9219_005545 [cf. Caloplaca sp. 3 TL-2023]
MLSQKPSFAWGKSWNPSKEIAITHLQELYQFPSPTREIESPKKIHPSADALTLVRNPPSSAPLATSSNLSPQVMQTYEPQQRKEPSRCPVSHEFQQARAHHTILASTGCTKEFCQAGRAVHTDEPRIGENRAIEDVEKEAEGFLRELYRESFFNSEEAFTKRLDNVLAEIRAGACRGVIRESRLEETLGGNWVQTPAELEFGIRRAWRNARKCIMRSHSDELKLCDLRHVASSTEMAIELVRHMCEAFNEGNVLPTVFLFPPRKNNSKGPMIWNHQVLEFAGYEQEDGTILGDPMSVELTKAIMELGWQPPKSRTRWDLLPLVVIANDDVPVMIEIPSPLCNLVQIRHPRFEDGFKELDLRWVAAPALTRLGFDIGGVQYTAAPFIGWFMDAEIGVRDLADTFRYNVLPDVARVLGLMEQHVNDSIESIDDLPEYERLSILSRAQTELTYAVYWSYQQAKVSMSDTLTANMKWCRYDDEFKEKNGFRLPADPYWLAPPQGSIIPLWHRGGAPNYQPKPMISKHVQDPLKAWKREKRADFTVGKLLSLATEKADEMLQLQPGSSADILLDQHYIQGIFELVNTPKRVRLRHTTPIPASAERIRAERNGFSISVYFCSAGAFAEKIATKLHSRLSDLAKSIPSLSVCLGVQPLNQLQLPAIDSSKIIFAVVSSTGQGEVPANGSQFIKMCEEQSPKELDSTCMTFRYAMYGNGDSRYATTYNGAAMKVEGKLRQIGGCPLVDAFHQGDTASQRSAVQALTPWWEDLHPILRDLATDSSKLRPAHHDGFLAKRAQSPSINHHREAKLRIEVRLRELANEYQRASICSVNPPANAGHRGTYLATLNIRERPYKDLDCIQILPTNSPTAVRKALRALGANASEPVLLATMAKNNPQFSTFLAEFVDLEAPFRDFEWLAAPLGQSKVPAVHQDALRSMSSLACLERLHELGVLPATRSVNHAICLALPPLHPRIYSIASSLSYNNNSPATLTDSRFKKPASRRPNLLDILVKPLPQGRFSHIFLSAPTSTPLRYRFVPSAASVILALPLTTPLIIVATGAGFAPVRCLLQRRIAASRPPSSSSSSSPSSNAQHSSGSSSSSSISLFLGLKPSDVGLLSQDLNEAAAVPGLMERMSVVSSNEDKIRVYDRLCEEGTRERLRTLVVGEGAWVFVCTGLKAAEGVRRAFEEVLGEDGGREGTMGERWVEEVF